MKRWPGWENRGRLVLWKGLTFVSMSVVKMGPRDWSWTVRSRGGSRGKYRSLASGQCKRRSMALLIAETVGSHYNTDAECEVRS